MRIHTMALILAGLVPLAACDANGAEQVGDAELEGGLETTPAAETTLGQNGFADWDADANAQLTRDEWGNWWSQRGIYDEWNTDAEEGLVGEELAGGAFAAWDVDNDNNLNQNEWQEGAGTWFADDEYGDWGEWDANGDSALDANEVAEAFERENLYDRVDRDSDALIDDEELADWWFDIWDGNDDALIDTTEWDQVGAEWTRIGAAR